MEHIEHWPLLFVFVRNSEFGYMMSSGVVKVASIRFFLWSLGWLHLDESKGIFGVCMEFSVNLGGNF